MENIDWGSLGFNYLKTDYNARYIYTDGKWSEMQISSDEYINMHMSASCLHYGTALFEGLKAFRGVDGKVRLFRVEENAKRLQSSAKRLCLPVPTIEMIVNACIEVVKRNDRFIRNGCIVLPASGYVRHNGRSGCKTLERRHPGCLRFAGRSILQGRYQTDDGCY